jgi:hypothetical protein
MQQKQMSQRPSKMVQLFFAETLNGPIFQTTPFVLLNPGGRVPGIVETVRETDNSAF